MNEVNKKGWTRLDNASKIFPSTSDHRDTKVFRISCELYEDVDPIILQQALDLSIESFPFYRSILRKGVFWYYFESSDILPKVELESQPVCAPIYIKDRRNLLFRVVYYKKRINVETFHALCDGAGAIWFMETLIHHYISIKHRDDLGDNIPDLKYKASISEKMDDSFGRNYNKKQAKKIKSKEKRPSKSYQIRGTKNDEYKTKVVEASMSTNDLLNLAHEYDTTLTVFLASLLIYSIHKERPARMKNKPITLAVPINLRPFFNSTTARNFFSAMSITYDFKNNTPELENIIQSINKDFKDNLNEKELYSHLNKFMLWEQNPFTRIIPLPIKDFFIRVADKLNDIKTTSSISNVGKFNIPKEFKKYIRQFSICVSARRPLITLCSYEDRLVISFSSPFRETDIQRSFFQFLSHRGIEVEILSNL